jgi:hypothetical protein
MLFFLLNSSHLFFKSNYYNNLDDVDHLGVLYVGTTIWVHVKLNYFIGFFYISTLLISLIFQRYTIPFFWMDTTDRILWGTSLNFICLTTIRCTLTRYQAITFHVWSILFPVQKKRYDLIPLFERDTLLCKKKESCRSRTTLLAYISE